MTSHASCERLRAIFSDIDGTVVHYKASLLSLGYEMVATTAAGDTSASIESGDIRPNLAPCPSVVWRHRESGRSVHCLEVPSATLGGGYISRGTLKLVDDLRRLGVAFVLMTGARTSTFLSRLLSHTLPICDYGVCEGGGRIWRLSEVVSMTDGVAPISATPTTDGDGDLHVPVAFTQRTVASTGTPRDLDQLGVCKLTLDTPWLDSMSTSAGNWRQQLAMDPASRVGRLWDVYRDLQALSARSAADGASAPTWDHLVLKLDALSFATAFLVDVRPPPQSAKGCSSTEAAEAALKERFSRLYEPKYGCTVVMNLGKGHVAPAGSSKQSVTSHICALERWDPRIHCAALFDDENDLEFAKLCGLGGYLPTIAHINVVAALVERNAPTGGQTHGSGHWHRPAVEGLLGTEEALTALLQRAREETAQYGPLTERPAAREYSCRWNQPAAESSPLGASELVLAPRREGRVDTSRRLAPLWVGPIRYTV